MNKVNYFGTKITSTNPPHQLKVVDKFIKGSKCKYVTYSNVHVVVTGKTILTLQNAVNNADIASPDGMPLVKVAKYKGDTTIEKCSGPDLIRSIIEDGLDKGYTHYFYGSTDDTLEKLDKALKVKYPEINILGMYSPPFRPLTDEEDQAICEEINRLSPDCIWIGLGAPKQEIWMYQHRDKLNRGVMFGVGAAFDFLAGTVDRAPKWMQNAGLEWFYRLCQEPKRLWKRYFVTNTLFIWYLLRYGVKIEQEN